MMPATMPVARGAIPVHMSGLATELEKNASTASSCGLPKGTSAVNKHIRDAMEFPPEPERKEVTKM